MGLGLIISCPVWQNFRYQIVGFRESSFSKKSNGSYTYLPNQKQKQIGIKYNTRKPKTKVLIVGNKTYILGRAAHPTSSPPTAAMDGYSIMQVPCFVHRVYLEMYFDPVVVPADAVEYVEELGKCEDILLSVVVTKFLHNMNLTKSGVLLVKNSLAMKNLPGMLDIHKDSANSTGSRPREEDTQDISVQSKCLNRFSQIYGHLPLQLSNTIATLV